jgi:hypothetical protein
VPKSRVRRKENYTPPPKPVDPSSKVSPRWLAPVMVACFLIGLAWIVVFYLAGNDNPLMSDIGNYNLIIGFAFIGVGFALATQWR